MTLTRREMLLASGAGLVALSACAQESGQEAPDEASVAAAAPAVRYEFIRNATARLHYAGQVLLLDPMLSDVGAFQSFAGIAPNPTVPLPRSAASIIEGVDFAVVSHLHSDHFDDAAAEILPKDLPIVTPDNDFLTDFSDPTARTSFKAAIEERGFTDVRTPDPDGRIEFGGITLRQTWGLHGRGQVGELLGGVNGLVLQAEGHPAIYWAGDTIWDEAEMQAVLEQYRPGIVIAHTGGPVIEAISPELLLMDAEQGIRFFEQASRVNPDVRMIAIHMESLDHCFSTRADLENRVAAMDESSQARIFIPHDGETLQL